MVTPWGCKLDTWHWIGIQIDQIECMFWEISPVILNSRLKKTNKGHKTAKKVRFSGFSQIFEDGIVTLFGWYAMVGSPITTAVSNGHKTIFTNIKNGVVNCDFLITGPQNACI